MHVCVRVRVHVRVCVCVACEQLLYINVCLDGAAPGNLADVAHRFVCARTDVTCILYFAGICLCLRLPLTSSSTVTRSPHQHLNASASLAPRVRGWSVYACQCCCGRSHFDDALSSTPPHRVVRSGGCGE